MAIDIICRARRFKNPKTGEYGQRAAVVNKEYDSSSLFDYAANSGFVPAGSKKEVIVPGFSQMMAAAKSLIETTGDARVLFADWLTVAVATKDAALKDGAIPETAKLVTTIRVHKGLKIDPTQFHLKLEGYDDTLAPKIDFLISAAAGAERSKLVRGQAIMINGRNFGEDDTALAVSFGWGEGEDAHSIAARISSCGENLIALTWPQEFNDLPAGTKVTATVKRTIDGRDYTSKPKAATLE